MVLVIAGSNWQQQLAAATGSSNWQQQLAAAIGSGNWQQHTSSCLWCSLPLSFDLKTGKVG
jgi:hypothetical protein